MIVLCSVSPLASVFQTSMPLHRISTKDIFFLLIILFYERDRHSVIDSRRQWEEELQESTYPLVGLAFCYMQLCLSKESGCGKCITDHSTIKILLHSVSPLTPTSGYNATLQTISMKDILFLLLILLYSRYRHGCINSRMRKNFREMHAHFTMCHLASPRNLNVESMLMLQNSCSLLLTQCCFGFIFKTQIKAIHHHQNFMPTIDQQLTILAQPLYSATFAGVY